MEMGMTDQIVDANNLKTPATDRVTVRCKCGNALAECTEKSLFLLGAEIRERVKIFCRAPGCSRFRVWKPKYKSLRRLGPTVEFRQAILADISNLAAGT